MSIGLAGVMICLTGYLLGSLNSAVFVSHLLKREDIRRQGSGNAGMTNMLRVYGKKAAALTALGDMAKAVLAVILARMVWQWTDERLFVDPGYLVGLFVLVGHIFPLYFAFRGGKGVMPALGIILWVNPLAFLILLVLAIPILLLTRTMSVVSLVSAVLLPVVTWLLCWWRQQDPLFDTLLMLIYTGLVIWSHRTNIRRLLHREENQIVSGSDQESK